MHNIEMLIRNIVHKIYKICRRWRGCETIPATWSGNGLPASLRSAAYPITNTTYLMTNTKESLPPACIYPGISMNPLFFQNP